MNKEEQTLPLNPALVLSFITGAIPKAEISELRPGQICPRCCEEKLNYDGMLNLICPRCGLTLGGCFT